MIQQIIWCDDTRMWFPALNNFSSRESVISLLAESVTEKKLWVQQSESFCLGFCLAATGRRAIQGDRTKIEATLTAMTYSGVHATSVTSKRSTPISPSSASE